MAWETGHKYKITFSRSSRKLKIQEEFKENRVRAKIVTVRSILWLAL